MSTLPGPNDDPFAEVTDQVPFSPVRTAVGWIRFAVAHSLAGGRTVLELIGGMVLLFVSACRWIGRSAYDRKVRLGKSAVVSQIVRVGVRSVFIVSLVSGCVGLILALQLAPPLDEFGGKSAVANIIGVAVLRELGPLIGSIVLTGFAGASIAAQLGTMVVSEEIEALEAHALNPIRFLVVPRVLACAASMTCLAVIANTVAISAAMAISVWGLDIPAQEYWANTLAQCKPIDLLTGLFKALIFGTLIGVVSCFNGLSVDPRDGADGVGKATTNTVVQCVVAIILADLVFTAVFFALDLN